KLPPTLSPRSSVRAAVSGAVTLQLWEWATNSSEPSGETSIKLFDPPARTAGEREHATATASTNRTSMELPPLVGWLEDAQSIYQTWRRLFINMRPRRPEGDR